MCSDADEQDMFCVPASQPNTNTQRRYISQRSMMQKTQQSQSSRTVARNYFEKSLIKCSVNLDNMDFYILGSLNCYFNPIRRKLRYNIHKFFCVILFRNKSHGICS